MNDAMQEYLVINHAINILFQHGYISEDYRRMLVGRNEADHEEVLNNEKN